MWEATCPPEYLEQLSAWLRDEVIPGALAKGCLGAEAFVGDGDPRLVLMTRWASREAMEAWEEGSGRDVTRSHAWTFRPLA
jgi:heme-degrading monooxygenase HmoA